MADAGSSPRASLARGKHRESSESLEYLCPCSRAVVGTPKQLSLPACPAGRLNLCAPCYGGALGHLFSLQEIKKISVRRGRLGSFPYQTGLRVGTRRAHKNPPPTAGRCLGTVAGAERSRGLPSSASRRVNHKAHAQAPGQIASR